jgi:hypothetical protein
MESFTHEDESVSRVLVFRTTAGVEYRVESSHDLVLWNHEQTYFGLGQEIAYPLIRIAAPVATPEHAPIPNSAPVKLVTLLMRKASTAGIVLSWKSLDHGAMVEHHINGLTPHTAWNLHPLYLRHFENYYFSLGHPSALAVPRENQALSPLDEAMIAAFVAHFEVMNQEVADNMARTRMQPISVPAFDPNRRKFFRIIADWSLDSDFDLTPDWLEFMAMHGQNGLTPVSEVTDEHGDTEVIVANPFGDALTADGLPVGKVRDTDKDGVADVYDVNAADELLNWYRASIRYAMFPVTIPAETAADDRRALQTNNLGQVLFRHSVWRAGAHTELEKSGLTSAFALAINDHGNILGNAIFPQGELVSGRAATVNLSMGLCWWTAADVPGTVIKATSPAGDEFYARMTEEHYSAGIKGLDVFDNSGRFCAPAVDADASFVQLPPQGNAANTALWSRNAQGQYEFEEIAAGHHFVADLIAPWKLPDANGLTEVEGKPVEALVSKYVRMPSGTRFACTHQNSGSSSHLAFSNQPWVKRDGLESIKDFAPTGVGIMADNRLWMNNGSIAMDDMAPLSPPSPQAWQDYQLLDLSPLGHLLMAKEESASSSQTVAHSAAALGYPVSLRDDYENTGVDCFSQSIAPTSAPNDGFQSQLWVMAPQGTWLHETQGPQPLTNDFHIHMPLGGLTTTFTVDNATSSSYQVTDDALALEFTGTGTNTNEGKITFRIGETTSISHPIGVKSMKRRTVNVHLYRCQHAATITPGQDDPYPYDATDITNHLNKVFGKQINAFFAVTESTIIAGQNNQPTPLYPTKARDGLQYITSETVHTMIAALPFPADVDIRVYASGHDIIAGWATAAGIAPENKNTVFLGPQRGFENMPEERKNIALRTLAHEIGHVICGVGHPDERSSIANLPGTDHSKRLMCSGNIWPSGSGLLVKREWDAAEVWLSNRPNGDH